MLIFVDMKDNKIFSVGETVVALTDPLNENSQPRRKGRLYNVFAVSYCQGCGGQSINIGQKAPSENGNIICGCGSKQSHYGLEWTDSKYFARPSELQQEMEAAAEIGDYELAIELRDILNASK